MNNQTSLPTTENSSPNNAKAETSQWSIQRIATLSAGVLGGIIVLIFVIGLLFAIFSDVEATAARMDIIKDTILIIMTLEVLLIIAALAIFIVQFARLINLLQSKAKPVLENAQQAVNSAKGTVEFVGENVTEPIVQAGAFMAGARVFISEVGGIRRAIRKNGKDEPHDEQK